MFQRATGNGASFHFGLSDPGGVLSCSWVLELISADEEDTGIACILLRHNECNLLLPSYLRLPLWEP